MPKLGVSGSKASNFLILTKFPHVIYFEGTDFKSDIRLPKFWAKMPKFGYYEPKSINFLILIFSNKSNIFHIPYIEDTNFKSEICFGKFQNVGFLGQRVSTFWS